MWQSKVDDTHAKNIHLLKCSAQPLHNLLLQVSDQRLEAHYYWQKFTRYSHLTAVTRHSVYPHTHICSTLQRYFFESQTFSVMNVQHVYSVNTASNCISLFHRVWCKYIHLLMWCPVGIIPVWCSQRATLLFEQGNLNYSPPTRYATVSETGCHGPFSYYWWVVCTCRATRVFFFTAVP